MAYFAGTQRYGKSLSPLSPEKSENASGVAPILCALRLGLETGLGKGTWSMLSR